MAPSVAYLDSSAFVKLVVAEPESAALVRAVARWPQRASATLVRTETIRALRRSGNSSQIPKARRLLRSVHMVHLEGPLLDRAGDLDPVDLGSLGAVHLAAALAIGEDLGIFFVYDTRLARAAELYGIAVASPSA